MWEIGTTYYTPRLWRIAPMHLVQLVSMDILPVSQTAIALSVSTFLMNRLRVLLLLLGPRQPHPLRCVPRKSVTITFTVLRKTKVLLSTSASLRVALILNVTRKLFHLLPVPEVNGRSRKTSPAHGAAHRVRLMSRFTTTTRAHLINGGSLI
jgi:hypothetical protein